MVSFEQWQGCQVHLKKNILDKVRNKDKRWIQERLDDIFSAPDKHTGFHCLQKLIEEVTHRYPDATDLLETGREVALACMNFPAEHRRRLRSRSFSDFMATAN